MEKTTINKLTVAFKILIYVMLIKTSLTQMISYIVSCKEESFQCQSLNFLSLTSSYFGILGQLFIIFLNIFMIYFIKSNVFTGNEINTLLYTAIIEIIGIGALDLIYFAISLYIVIATHSITWIISVCLVPISTISNFLVLGIIFNKIKTDQASSDYKLVQIQV